MTLSEEPISEGSSYDTEMGRHGEKAFFTEFPILRVFASFAHDLIF